MPVPAWGSPCVWHSAKSLVLLVLMGPWVHSDFSTVRTWLSATPTLLTQALVPCLLCVSASRDTEEVAAQRAVLPTTGDDGRKAQNRRWRARRSEVAVARQQAAPPGLNFFQLLGSGQLCQAPASESGELGFFSFWLLLFLYQATTQTGPWRDLLRDKLGGYLGENA